MLLHFLVPLYMARQISLLADREKLMKQAAALESEADALESSSEHHARHILTVNEQSCLSAWNGQGRLAAGPL